LGQHKPSKPPSDADVRSDGVRVREFDAGAAGTTEIRDAA
jgi:hypothetical protein